MGPEEILEQIDCALEDLTVSDDAVRQGAPAGDAGRIRGHEPTVVWFDEARTWASRYVRTELQRRLPWLRLPPGDPQTWLPSPIEQLLAAAGLEPDPFQRHFLNQWIQV